MHKDLIWALKRGLAAALALAMLPAQAGPCGDMFVHAHRGAPGHPENSMSAILAALRGPWDGVEIDAQQLADRTWVVHHDPILGRVSSHMGKFVRDMTPSSWADVRLKDRQGRLTNEAPALLEQVLAESAKYPEKTLNIEMKSGGSCTSIEALVALVRRYRPDGNWFITHISPSLLNCARSADRQGYLGLITIDPASLIESNRFTRNQQLQVRPRSITVRDMRGLRDALKTPVGYHVDTITLGANLSFLPDAKALGLPVVTYHLGEGGDRNHASTIRDTRARTGLIPSGAVIDGDPAEFCSQALR